MTAVDGRDLDLTDDSLVDPVLLTRLGASEGGESSLLPGSAGCALSHLQVYQSIVEAGADWGLVLEDDIVLSVDLGDVAQSVVEHLTGAEVVLLGYESPEPCQMSRLGAIRLPSGRVLALPVDIRQPRSSGAYVITREACERLVKSFLPVRVQADGWWFYYREGLLDRVRCVTPMPVVKNGNFTSTIGSYSLSTGLKARIAKQLLSRKIPVLDQAMAYRRRRIYRQWGQSELVDLPFVEKASRLD